MVLSFIVTLLQVFMMAIHASLMMSMAFAVGFLIGPGYTHDILMQMMGMRSIL